MCLIESLFDEIQRYDYGQVFRLTAAAVDELWLLTMLCPLFVTDLRSDTCTEFALVDASNDWEAEVTTEVSRAVALELGRQRLTRAAWSRLLTPYQAVQRLHGSLAPAPPGEEAAVDHPLWSGVIKSSKFRLQWRKRVFNKPHINVSEMAAALRSESRRARRWPGKPLLTGSDSQVVLGALIKGRSSSKVPNGQLKRALPSVLAYNCYNYTQYVGTGDNVADDPTRDRACRLPTSAVASWTAAIDHGDYDGLDKVLLERGVDDASVARLTMDADYWSPDALKRGGQVPVDAAGSLAADSPTSESTTTLPSSCRGLVLF